MGDPLTLGLGAGFENQRIDPSTGKAFVAQPEQQAPSVQHASLAGPGPSFSTPKPQQGHPDERVGMMKTTSAQGMPRTAQAVRPLSNDELLAKANELIDNQRAQAQGSLSQGPSTGARNEAGGQIPEWLKGYMEGT